MAGTFDEYKHSELTGAIIHCAQTVHSELGSGFLEKVYHNALLLELKKTGMAVESEKPITVYYQGQIVGEYVADMVVAQQVILEIKAVRTIDPAHEVQLVNYLKATRIEVGLLLNFGKSLEVRRRVLTSHDKPVETA